LRLWVSIVQLCDGLAFFRSLSQYRADRVQLNYKSVTNSTQTFAVDTTRSTPHEMQLLESASNYCYFVLLSTESSGYRLSGVYCYGLRLNDGSKSEEGVFIRTAFVYGELFLAHSGRLVGFRSGNETFRGKARKRSLNAAASKRWLKSVLPNIFFNFISMKSHGFVRREGKDQVAIKRELIHFISFHSILFPYSNFPSALLLRPAPPRLFHAAFRAARLFPPVLSFFSFFARSYPIISSIKMSDGMRTYLSSPNPILLPRQEYHLSFHPPLYMT
jgi:hypothetical protein